MKDKFATFAEKCEHRTSEIDFEPPIGSGEPEDGPRSTAWFECHHLKHPNRNDRWNPSLCSREDCPRYLEWGEDEE